MAFMCLNLPGSCHSCPHYRFDPDKNRDCCFAEFDNNIKSLREKLKKCPLCGSKPVIKPHISQNGYDASVYCPECGNNSSATIFDSAMDAALSAAKQWNERI